MIEFKKILVPVDSSDYAKAALKYALNLARGTDSEILAVHVVQPVAPAAYVSPMGGFVGGYVDPYPERMESAEGYLEELKALITGVRCRTLLRTGDPGQEIVAAALEEKVDVIVMSTHGRTGLSRLLMGSTAEAVIRHATVPVMTLRAEVLLKSEAPPEPTGPVKKMSAV